MKTFLSIITSFVLCSIVLLTAGIPEAAAFTVSAAAVPAGIMFIQSMTPDVLFVIPFSNFTGPAPGKKNMGGTKTTVYYALKDDFDLAAGGLKDLPAAPTSFSEYVTISDTHVFLAGKGFHTLEITLDKGQVKDDIQGDYDGWSFKNIFTGFYPGSEAEFAGFMSYFMNCRSIWLVPLADIPTANIRQIGDINFYAQVKPSYDTLTNSKGARGFPFTVETFNPVMLYYTGAIDLISTS